MYSILSKSKSGVTVYGVQLTTFPETKNERSLFPFVCEKENHRETAVEPSHIFSYIPQCCGTMTFAPIIEEELMTHGHGPPSDPTQRIDDCCALRFIAWITSFVKVISAFWKKS